MRIRRFTFFMLAALSIFILAACTKGLDQNKEASSSDGSAKENGIMSDDESAKDEDGDGIPDDMDLSEEAINHDKDGQVIIGISMPAQHLERWNRDGKYLQNAFEKAGYTTKVAWADNKIDTQQKDIHNLINSGVDILLIAAVDGTALHDVLDEANAVDIPVIAYDRIIESKNVEYYVSFDNYGVGKLQGEFIRDALDLDHAGNKTYNMEIVSGYSADKNADGYYYGAHDLLEPYIKNGTLIIASGEESYAQTETFQWSTEYANERMCSLLSSFYSSGRELNAVLCANDSAAIGVADAIETDYRKDNPVILTGQDGDEENLKNIMDGKQSMTVYKCLPHETEVMFQVTMAFLNNEPIDESLIKKAGWDFEVSYSDKAYSNGTDYMKSFILTPVAVTKDNMKEELIDTGYYTIGKDGYPKATE